MKLQKKTLLLLLLLPVLTLTNLTGCKTVLISADQQETFVDKSKSFTPPVDGVFMPLARYQRYRRAVADKIQLEEEKPAH